MSFPISFSDLDEADSEQIATDLLIQPKSTLKMPPHVLAKMPPTVAMAMSAPPPPFNFFQLNKESDTLKIPFYYASEVFGLENMGLEHKLNKWEKLSSHNRPTIEILRPEQIPVVKQTLNELKKYHTTTIGLPPGFGKTIMGGFLSSELGFKTAIFVPREPLVGQWLKTIATLFYDNNLDLAKKMTYCPSQPATEQKKKLLSEFPYDFIITLIGRADAIHPTIKARIGTLILDEAHMLCTAERVKYLLAFSPKYIIAETATMERTDGAHDMMRLLVGTHGFFQSSEREFTVFNLLLEHIALPEKLSKAQTLDYSAFCKSSSENKDLNDAIISMVVKNPHRKFFILTRLVEHAKWLSEQFVELGLSSTYMCGTKKRHKDVDILCGSFPKIGTGYDVATAADEYSGKPADTLILCHTVKSWQPFEQMKGRIMRCGADITPVVIWLSTTNSITKRHLTGLKSHIRKTGGKIVDITDVENIHI